MYTRIKMDKRSHYTRGFTIPEMLVYMSILIITTVVIVFVVLSTSTLYGRNRMERRVSLAAEVAMERILREVRLGCQVVSIGSQTMTLKTFSDFSTPDDGSTTCDSTDVTKIVNREIKVDSSPSQNTIKVGAGVILPTNVQATSLTFTQLQDTNAATQAVRVSMTLVGGVGTKYQVSRTYTGMATLRGSY